MALPSLPLSHFPKVVGRILLGGNRAARFALGVAALGLAVSPLDRMLSVVERRRRGDKSDPPVLFVVGLPRSGSTVVAERLSRLLPVVALNSAMSVLPHSRHYVHRLLKKWRPRRKAELINYYGHGLGWLASGDTYAIWDQWLGPCHHLPPKLAEEQAADMVDYFRGLHEVYGQPILAKNNRNSLLIARLAELFPKAIFVVVERDLEEVVRSTSRATSEFGLNDRVWGLSSTEKPETFPDGDVAAACRRSVEKLQAAMESQLFLVAADRVFRVPYAGFLADPNAFLGPIARRLG